MQLTKFISSFALAGLFALPAIADGQDGNAVRAVEARVPTTLLVEVREPKTTPAKASPTPPGKSTAPTGKSGTDKNADLQKLSMKKSASSPKPPTAPTNLSCKRKQGGGGKSKAKGKVAKRAPNWKPVYEGTSVTGEATDATYTWSLKTCAGAAAVDTSSKRKVQAHITALTGTADYKAQWAVFKADVEAHTTSANRQVTLALGPLQHATTDLHATMTEMNNWLTAEAYKLDANADVFTRSYVAEGSKQHISDSAVVFTDGTC